MSPQTTQEIFGRQAAAAIMSRVEELITCIPREQRAQFTLWHFDEETLIKEDIHYDNFLVSEIPWSQTLPLVEEECRVLRREVRHYWKAVGGSFKLYWLRRLTPAQREGLTLAAFIHTSQTPRGDEFRKYLIDLSPTQLIDLNGKVLISFIEELINQASDFTVAPLLGHRLLQVFAGWDLANSTHDEVAEHKSLFLQQLRMRIHISRLIFALRTVHKIVEMWQSFILPYAPSTAVAANPYRLQNNYDGTFKYHDPPHDTDVGQIPKKASKKKAKKSRGKNAKAEYQLRKKERRGSLSPGPAPEEVTEFPPVAFDPVEIRIEETAMSPGEETFLETSSPPKQEISSESVLPLAPAKVAISPTEGGSSEPTIDSVPVPVQQPLLGLLDQFWTNTAASRSLVESVDGDDESIYFGSPLEPIPGERAVKGAIDSVFHNIQLDDARTQHIKDLWTPAIFRSFSPKAEPRSDACSYSSSESEYHDAPSFIEEQKREETLEGPHTDGEIDLQPEQIPEVPELVQEAASAEYIFHDDTPSTPAHGLSPKVEIVDHDTPELDEEFSLKSDGTTTVVQAYQEPGPPQSDEAATPVKKPVLSVNTGSRRSRVYVAVPDQLFKKKKVSTISTITKSMGRDEIKIKPEPLQVDNEPLNLDFSKIADGPATIAEPAFIEEMSVDIMETKGIRTEMLKDDNGLKKWVAHHESFDPGSSRTADEPAAITEPTVVEETAVSSVEKPATTISPYIMGLESAVSEVLQASTFTEREKAEYVVRESPTATEEKLLSGPSTIPNCRDIEDHKAKGEGLPEGPGFLEAVHGLLMKSYSEYCSRRNSEASIDPSMSFGDELRRSSIDNSFTQQLTVPYHPNAYWHGDVPESFGYGQQGYHHDDSVCAVPPLIAADGIVGSPQHFPQEPFQTALVSKPTSFSPNPFCYGLNYLPSHAPSVDQAYFCGSSGFPEHQGTAYHRSPIGKYGYYGDAEVCPEISEVLMLNEYPLSGLQFNCAACNREVTHESSVLCLRCGVNCKIRFCDDRCRYSAPVHWMACGNHSFKFKTDYDPGEMYWGPLQTTADLNPWRYWQATILFDYPGFDYLIFAKGFEDNKQPLVQKAIVFKDQILRDRFYAVFKLAFWNQDAVCVRMVWRTVCAWIQQEEWDIDSATLEQQFEMEFGKEWSGGNFSIGPRSMPTEEDWIETINYIRETLRQQNYYGDTLSNIPSTKLPLVGKEPPIPFYIEERTMSGSAQSLGR